MLLCSHEEADSRMCLHVKDALEKGALKIFVRAVDSEVVVILTDIYLSCKCIFRPASLGRFFDWKILQILLYKRNI